MILEYVSPEDLGGKLCQHGRSSPTTPSAFYEAFQQGVDNSQFTGYIFPYQPANKAQHPYNHRLPYTEPDQNYTNGQPDNEADDFRMVHLNLAVQQPCCVSALIFNFCNVDAENRQSRQPLYRVLDPTLKIVPDLPYVSAKGDSRIAGDDYTGGDGRPLASNLKATHEGNDLTVGTPRSFRQVSYTVFLYGEATLLGGTYHKRSSVPP